MEKIGSLLKSEREKKGLSLHEIGMTLKINPKVLTAIEEDDQKNLPAKTFLKGFVKSYAQYLKMDHIQIMKNLSEEMGETKNPETTSATNNSPKDIIDEKQTKYNKEEKVEKKTKIISDDSFGAKKIYTILISIFLIGIIVFVAKMIDKYQKEGRKAETLISTDTLTTETIPEKTEVTPLPALETAPSAKSDATTEPTTQVIAQPATTALPATVAPSTPVVATPIPSPATAAVTEKAAVQSNSPVPAAQTPAVKPVAENSPTDTSAKPVEKIEEKPIEKFKPTEIIVEALNKVEIKYSFGGGVFESIQLLPDQVHTFKSKKVLLLEFNDGGAVNVIVNGRDKGVPGTIGKPLKLSYPK